MSVVLRELESGKLTVERATARVASTEGWLKHANTRHFSLSLKLAEIKRRLRIMKKFSDFADEQGLVGEKDAYCRGFQ